METNIRSEDLFRALVIADHDKGLPEVASNHDAEEGEAFKKAAHAVKNHPDREVCIQRSCNGPEGPWLRYG